MSTRRDELEASWARSRTHLESAFERLSESGADRGGASFRLYREFLEHNELGLALEQLEELGEANPVERAFWDLLSKAAAEMKLDDHRARYEKERTG